MTTGEPRRLTVVAASLVIASAFGCATQSASRVRPDVSRSSAYEPIERDDVSRSAAYEPIERDDVDRDSFVAPALVTRESRTIRVEREPTAPTDFDSGPRDGTRRIRRGRQVDVSFREADLANALRFLASAGGIDLVLSGGLAGTVTVELRRVRALDAIVALAEAHGATVETHRGIVVVRAR